MTQKALLLDKIGDKKAAIQTIKEACQQHPQDLTAVHTAGCLHMYNHRLPEAISYFNQELAIQPGKVDALIGRAIVYQMMEKGNEALEDLNLAISKEPKNSRSYKIRAEVYRYLLNEQELFKKDMQTYHQLKGGK